MLVLTCNRGAARAAWPVDSRVMFRCIVLYNRVDMLGEHTHSGRNPLSEQGVACAGRCRVLAMSALAPNRARRAGDQGGVDLGAEVSP